MHAALMRSFRQFAGQPCGGGCMVDENRVPLHGDKGAMTAERDFAHVIIATDATQYDIGVCRCLGGRRSGTAAILLDPGFRLLPRSIENRDVKSGAFEMARHRKTHDAQTKKTDAHYSMASTWAGCCAEKFGFRMSQMIRNAGKLT